MKIFLGVIAGFLAIILLLAIGLGIYWALEASNVVTYNIKREAIQHSQQYTETKVSLLNKLYNDWLQLDSEIAELKNVAGNAEILSAKFAQQKETAIRIKTEAELIPASEVPPEILRFVNEL